VAYAAVVFDLFGTLVPNYDLRVYADLEQRIAARLGLAPEELRKGWGATATERMSGQYLTLAHAYAVVSRTLMGTADPVACLAAEQMRCAVAATLLVPRAEDLATLAALREAGLRLGLVSNCTPEVPALWRASPLAPLIDAPIFSTEVHLVKPDPSIYRHAAELLDVAPSECLYVGDGEHQELTGAAEVGMTANLLRRAERDGQMHDPEADAWPGTVITEIPQLRSLLERRLSPSAH
jgi:putative hydrolase of the HAD superfamily